MTVQTNRLGATPSLLAYNSGHFFPGSNTRDWWRYSGVTGARVFMSPSEIEPADDVAPVGDGVTSAATFLTRRAAIRTNQFSAAYINWAAFSNRYESNDLYPNNHIRPNYTFGELRKLGIQICAQITASQSRLPIATTTDWGNMWELWQHYYAQAFYLARVFAVERYQMYNEPNHPNANGLTITNHLLRLQLVSDAVQLAIADVNALYGKSLAPKILAPVSAGNASSAYPGWGESVVTNRQVNFLGQTDPNFSLLHVYDYHQYGSSPAGFGASLADLNGLLAAELAPAPRYPTAISEFNTRTGATYDTMTETLDTPAEYARFGAIAVNLIANQCDELYCFKFSQTESSAGSAYPVQKNAMHYVDNSLAPYQVGGITRGGEVWRLFNKAFAAGRDRLTVVKSPDATSLEVSASYDPATRRYYVFSANNTAGSLAWDLDLSALNITVGNKVLIEEVSETNYGAGKLWLNLPPSRIVSGLQPANTVWLFSVSPPLPQTELVVTATDDAEVRDGPNQGNNYGAVPAMTARNDPADLANRSVAFLKFPLPTNDLATLEFAVLSVQAATASLNTTAQAHVYGLTNTSWSQAALTWSNAPNLQDNVAAGATIANGFIEGQGTNAFIVGQLVATAPTASEKLIDVTAYLRGQTGSHVAFLIAQVPRWNVTLPSQVPGDLQPDGVRISTTESGTGPRLRLVFNQSGNLPPTAVNDSAITLSGVPVAIGVLSNDSDSDGGDLSLQSFTQGSSGSVSNNGNGTLTYRPNPGFAGADRFSYTISDGQGGSAGADVNVTVNPSGGGTPYFTNLPLRAEANIRGGASAATDVDEIAQGYLMVKYNPAPFDAARKAYFQFDLADLDVNVNTAATFTVTTHTSAFRHRAQLWGLNQVYADFSSSLTWNTAAANELTSNQFLTNGAFQASPLGASFLFPYATSTAYSFTIPRIGDYLFGHRVTLAFSGVEDALNDAGGLRFARATAVLQVLVVPPLPPPSDQPPQITSIVAQLDGSITMSCLGTPSATHWIQATTNLLDGSWLSVSTNLAATNGTWSFTDATSTNFPQRFYRAVRP